MQIPADVELQQHGLHYPSIHPSKPAILGTAGARVTLNTKTNMWGDILSTWKDEPVISVGVNLA